MTLIIVNNIIYTYDYGEFPNAGSPLVRSLLNEQWNSSQPDKLYVLPHSQRSTPVFLITEVFPPVL